MIERILLSIVLLVIGFVAYRLFTRYHLQRASAGANADPILQDLKPGVPTIVYFTTPMCAPCETQQTPAIKRLQTELGENNIQIVKVDAIEDPEAAERWGVFSAPTTFILDSDKQVREVNHGVADTQKLKRQVQIIAKVGLEQQSAA